MSQSLLPGVTLPKANDDGDIQDLAERLVLERYAPAYGVLDAEGRVVQASPRFAKYLQRPAGAPAANIADIAYPALRAALSMALGRTSNTGQPAYQPQITLNIDSGHQTIDVFMHPQPDRELYVVVCQDVVPVDAISDITYLQRAERQRQTLVHELQHRVKNIIATIAALASRLGRSSASLAAFNTDFGERLATIGRMHDLLSRHNWDGAELRTLIETILESFNLPQHDAMRYAGVSLMVNANAASTLGMVLHELATNAAKYGALSTAQGYIDVRCERVRKVAYSGILLSWSERGGPPVTAPVQAGFGTTFVQRSVEYELEGQAAFDYLPDGLRCSIAFPDKFVVD